MNDLSHNFPEINAFFDQESFTDIELEGLIKCVDLNYSDDIKKAAYSLIRLKVVKFKIIKKISKVKNKKKVTKTQKEEKKIENYAKFRKISSVSKLCKFLEISSNYLISILKQKGIVATQDTILTNEEYKQIKSFVSSRKKAIKRLDKQKQRENEKINKNINKFYANKPYNNRSIGVYEKVATYGFGKLIYIKNK